MKVAVSIITPCYNAAGTIRDTIESVQLQTFSNWEMIIVDDCSCDNSMAIIEDYAAKDSRIRCFQTDSPSGSPSLPRNIGIEHANGEYIAFLDSDDLWLPDKLEKQMDFIASNHCDFVYSDYEKIDYAGCRSNRVVKMPNCSTFWDVIETCTIPCLTVIISKEIIGKCRFRSIPKEDFIFWLEILKQGVKAYNVGEVLALYREQNSSRSANKFKMIANQWYVLREVEGVKPVIATYFMLKFIAHGFLKFIK